MPDPNKKRPPRKMTQAQLEERYRKDSAAIRGESFKPRFNPDTIQGQTHLAYEEAEKVTKLIGELHTLYPPDKTPQFWQIFLRTVRTYMDPIEADLPSTFKPRITPNAK